MDSHSSELFDGMRADLAELARRICASFIATQLTEQLCDMQLPSEALRALHEQLAEIRDVWRESALAYLTLAQFINRNFL
jgi:hypothetical protein